MEEVKRPWWSLLDSSNLSRNATLLRRYVVQSLGVTHHIRREDYFMTTKGRISARVCTKQSQSQNINKNKKVAFLKILQ